MLIEAPAGAKIRGRTARQLGALLEDLAEDGVRRVILDMRETGSLDSLAVFGLEAAIERGVRVHLVVRKGFRFDGCFRGRTLMRSVAQHEDLDSAIRAVRDIVDSGYSLA